MITTADDILTKVAQTTQRILLKDCAAIRWAGRNSQRTPARPSLAPFRCNARELAFGNDGRLWQAFLARRLFVPVAEGLT